MMQRHTNQRYILMLIISIVFLWGLNSCSSKEKETFSEGIGLSIPKVSSESFAELDIVLKTNNELLGLEFTLKWDDTLLELGDPKASENNSDFSVQYKKENGRMRIIMFSFKGELIQTGGSIVHLPIKAKTKSNGETAITIESAIFAGRNGSSFDLPVHSSTLKLEE